MCCFLPSSKVIVKFNDAVLPQTSFYHNGFLDATTMARPTSTTIFLIKHNAVDTSNAESKWAPNFVFYFFSTDLIIYYGLCRPDWFVPRLEEDLQVGAPGRQQYLHCSLAGHSRVGSILWHTTHMMSFVKFYSGVARSPILQQFLLFEFYPKGSSNEITFPG